MSQSIFTRYLSIKVLTRSHVGKLIVIGRNFRLNLKETNFDLIITDTGCQGLWNREVTTNLKAINFKILKARNFSSVSNLSL